MKQLFHITTRTAWNQAQLIGSYIPSGFEAEGFIHCSYRHQVVATANRIFYGLDHLVLLDIHAAALACPIVDENLEGGTQLFPHIYGPLPLDAVTNVYDFPCRIDGSFQLPGSLQP